MNRLVKNLVSKFIRDAGFPVFFKDSYSFRLPENKIRINIDSFDGVKNGDINKRMVYNSFTGKKIKIAKKLARIFLI